ncbi:MAG: peptide chain release factor 2 [Deltaproteobacteria bacterium CG07_land_8_20_14_0_80_60_11]|nr:MAG: peptide chain release factor 2 [Deltaproteobacteria bacterium CG07_land_8_20_14_0_80_60_11]
MLPDSVELKIKLKGLQDRLETLRGHLDLAGKQVRLRHLEELMAAPELWDDQARAADILRERASLIQATEEYAARRQQLEDLELMLDMGLEEEDRQTLKEVARDLTAMEREFSGWELKLLLGAEDDDKNAIVTIHAGAGGTEAQDWAEILLRMYLRYAERKGFKTETIDLLPGDEAGVKSVTFTVSGPYANGYLKSENGIHRLVRISPFDASGRRHTSFAAVQVLPEVDDRIAIDIQENDLRIDTFRASGPGGQHVNKTSSAVRLTHLPTGLVVSSQSERSQHRNKELAMKVLRARLYNLEKRKQEDKKHEMQESQKDIAWGSQIRSYTLQPYRMIKDHRTKHEEGNVDAVLDGDLDRFVEAYLLNPGEE